MRKSIRIVLLMAAFVTATAQAGAQTISFSLTEVCASWQYCKPQGINANGQVVGYTDPINGAQHAFLWDNANPIQFFQDLGPGIAKGINNSGQVVGGSPAPPYGFPSAFLWDSVHGMQNIGSTFGVLTSQANAINSSGQVVGYLGTSAYYHPFLWDSANGMQDLGTLAGGVVNFAYGINDSGQVVGQSDWAFGVPHAFLWNGVCAGPGLFCAVPTPPYDNVSMHDLGPGWATGINNHVSMNGEIGPIAPMAGATVDGRAVLWKVVCCVTASQGQQDPYLTSSTLQDLGGGLSVATGINNSGQAVGYSYLPGVVPIGEGRPDHAVFWDSQGTLKDINPPGWTLSEAVAINDSGQIVGFGWNANGLQGFLLTPAPGSFQNAPLLPSVTSPGFFTFIGGPSGLWFDAPTAFGFEYLMTSGSLFTSILDFPTGFKSPFTVATPGCAIPGTFVPGASLNFVALCGHGVSGFTLSGIDPLVDPANPTGFPLKLEFNTPTADFTMRAFSRPIPGDLNGDGIVDCADLSIVRGSFGKRTGQPGFDPRADVNHDGVVNVRDLAFVAQRLPAGTVCP